MTEEIRDGVALEPKPVPLPHKIRSGVIHPGTVFPLCLEVISKPEEESHLPAFFQGVEGLTEGDFLGSKRSRLWLLSLVTGALCYD